MDKTPDRSEFLDILDALCHDRLDAEQHARLQRLLNDDPDAQRLYLDYLDTHLALKKLARGAELESAAILGTSCPGPGMASRRSGLPRRIRIGVMLLGVAATVLALLLCFPPMGGRPGGEARNKAVTVRPLTPLDQAPRLVQNSRARFYGRRLLPLGSRLPFGEEFVLTHGLLEIEFADGATTILHAPAVFEVADRARLVVKMGGCSVHAPDGAEGFRVETPVAETVDLGTRFSVEVGDTGETEVQVVEGLAEVYAGGHPRAGTRPVRLSSGQARKYSLDGKLQADDVRFDRSKYVAQLPDRIVTYDATAREDGGAEELRSVSVQRGGTLRTYQLKDLLGINVVHYKAEPKGSIATGSERLDPEQGDAHSRRRLGLLDRDAMLTTGVINPGGSRVPLVSDPVINDPENPSLPNTPGFAVRFQEPVINSPGPDVVLFDVQLIIHREKGDPFYVSPLHFAPGLKTHAVVDYDIDLLSPEARTLAEVRVYQYKKPLHALSDLARDEHTAGRKTSVRTKALAVGIDLSDLGYEPGAAVEGLFFQSMLTERPTVSVLDMVDPVFIAGFPPAEPAGARDAR